MSNNFKMSNVTLISSLTIKEINDRKTVSNISKKKYILIFSSCMIGKDYYNIPEFMIDFHHYKHSHTSMIAPI